MKKKLFTLITMFLPMMASAFETESSNVSGTRGVGDVNVGVVLHNLSSEDIYITGHIQIAISTPAQDDWGPIYADFDPVSEGCAMYRIPAGQTAVVPYYQINYSVNSKDPNEFVGKYLGGVVYPWIYCRVYSWTDAHDPAVVPAECLSTTFQNGGYLEFNLVGIKHDEGNITPCPNAITLVDGDYTPAPPSEQTEPEQTEPDPTPPAEQCKKPTIEFNNGELSFSSETNDVVFYYTIAINGVNGNTISKVDLSEQSLMLRVVVVASKDGYRDSDEAVAEFPLLDVKGVRGDLTGDGVVNVADHVELTKIIMNQDN